MSFFFFVAARSCWGRLISDMNYVISAEEQEVGFFFAIWVS